MAYSLCRDYEIEVYIAVLLKIRVFWDVILCPGISDCSAFTFEVKQLPHKDESTNTQQQSVTTHCMTQHHILQQWNITFSVI
jgi:hypothetical protein